MTKVPTGSPVAVAVAGRATTAGDYRVRVRFLTNRTLGLALVRTTAAGTETVLRAESVLPGVTYVANEWVRVRIQVTGSAPTTVRAKVWTAGATEPTAWSAQVTDRTVGLQGTGGIGLRAVLAAAATNAPVKVLVDDVRAVVPTG